ncbi:MAG TPA: hypothetical protein VF746_07550 [Longimicrobium sp.]|jgi:hypothetical protein
MPRLVHHWRTPYWRHTLEETSEMIAAAGFLVRRMYEPHPRPEQVRRMPADLIEAFRHVLPGLQRIHARLFGSG